MKPLLAILLLASLSLEAQRRRPSTSPVAPQPSATLGSGLPGLTPAQQELLHRGRIEFINARVVENGLGPVFNARSCAECHTTPVIGGNGGRTVQRVGAVVDGVYFELKEHGGSVIQVSGIGGLENATGTATRFRGESIPKQATIVVRRRTTALFGLGLVDATDDSTFIALAAAQAARGDGTAGRVSLVHNILAGMKTVGKFGWKAQVPTVQQFSGEAYVSEMGITSPLFPDEICPSGNCALLQFNPQPGLNDDGHAVDAAASFMRFLAPPSRGPITADVRAGEAVFSRIGCDSCHVATLQTGANAIPALHRVTYHPYSDFLLHDMGSLGDGIEQDAAKANEMRTAPLWGLRFIARFLHDNRATSLEEAILMHDGQGLGARERFKALDEGEKSKLIAFLRSL
jgi:CxxC motif-containing protein (DUF1111 family)